MTCDELRSREAALARAVLAKREDVAEAKAEVIDDPAHKAKWQAEVKRLQAELNALLDEERDVQKQIATQCVSLKSVSITFTTHGDAKAPNTLLHVFVKNRSSDTSF